MGKREQEEPITPPGGNIPPFQAPPRLDRQRSPITSEPELRGRHILWVMIIGAVIVFAIWGQCLFPGE